MISPEVMQELMTVRQVLHYLPASPTTEKGWTPHEQHLFWVALIKYPQGPWTAIADYIGTKSTRQAMTHAQKLRQKFKRWNKRLRRNPAARALMDSTMMPPADADSSTIAVTSGVAAEATFATGQQAKEELYMEATATSSGVYYSESAASNQDEITLNDFTVVSESKVDGDSAHHHFHPQQQYVHQLGYMLGGYASTSGGEHLPTMAHVAPPSYPLGGDHQLGSAEQQFHLPAASIALPPLHPSPATLESVDPHNLAANTFVQSPHPSPLMSRAMMDDLVHMLMDVNDDDEEEDEEDEEDDGEDMGEDDE